MKAISLWQPWASAIACGAKRIETRSWPTNHRGPILIHAAKRYVWEEAVTVQCSWTWCGALRPLGLKMGGDKELRELLPFGAIVATANLVDCRPTASFSVGEIEEVRKPEGEGLDLYYWTERLMGDFTVGRFGLVLENVVPLTSPIPFSGKQGLFDVPASLIEGATTS